MEANYPAARVTRLVGSEKNTVYTKPSYLASMKHMSVLKWAIITRQIKKLCNKIKIQLFEIYKFISFRNSLVTTADYTHMVHARQWEQFYIEFLKKAVM